MDGEVSGEVVDLDDMVGCEDCAWIGGEDAYPDHYLGAHIRGGGEGRDALGEGPAEGGGREDEAPGLPHHPPDPHDPMFGQPGLPAWVTEFRPHQWQAIREIMEAYDDGAEVVFLDAPTGSGKTLIGETVRRLLEARALYVCSDKSLQDQFVRDYPYAMVLKGRSNYPTVSAPYPMVTAADCTKEPGVPGSEAECRWCPVVQDCPYEGAKMEAYRSPIACINTAYLLTEANHVGKIGLGRDLVILDECDVIEQQLMGFVQFELTDRALKELGVEAPPKGVRKTTIAKWFRETLGPAVRDRLKGLPRYTDDVKVLRQRTAWERLLRRVEPMAEAVDDDNWVRDNKAGPLVLKPVKVDGYGQGNLWRHGKRWLCMSATIVSAEEMAESLGLDGGAGVREGGGSEGGMEDDVLGDVDVEEPIDWRVVKVPMTFPVENRRMNVVGVANMVAREKEDAYPKMARAIGHVVDRHPGERVLVHTVSYDLARYLHREVGKQVRGSRVVVTYTQGRDREDAIRRYRQHEGAIMFAPSLDRGVDFKGDDCRVVVVAKVPFPYLGDTQVSQRLHMPGGQQWYAVQTVRSLVQMTGRGVRSEDDWCVVYVLDKQFGGNVYRKNKGLLPEWWKEALETGYDGRWLKK